MIPENEYAPYYKNYIQQIEKNGKSIVANLEISQKEFEESLSELSEEKQLYAYETGKWTVKEVVQHVIDTERVFCYRALRFARNDKTALPGFDQDLFVANVDANRRNWTDLLAEMAIVLYPSKLARRWPYRLTAWAVMISNSSRVKFMSSSSSSSSSSTGAGSASGTLSSKTMGASPPVSSLTSTPSFLWSNT